MKYLEHPYFGKLNTEGLDDYDVLWQGKIPYKNESVIVYFWFYEIPIRSIAMLSFFLMNVSIKQCRSIEFKK